MKFTTISYLLCIASVLTIAQSPVAAEDGFTGEAALKTFLHEKFDGKDAGMVIGLVDDRGCRTYGAGRLESGTREELNGDTVFEIGSITKTFTALLLQDMVERGEMKLDDPVVMYLPKTVKMPARNGKEITLLNLAAQDSGLPFNPGNLSSGANPFADYTAEKLYSFLSGYTLVGDPGAKFEYSNLGMGLLGHVMALKTGAPYESLVVDRICRPLHMDSTRIALPEGLSARLAPGHDSSGKSVPNFEFQALAGCGALRSSANDLLKYVSANLGLTQSTLTLSMEKTQLIRHRGDPVYGDTAMPWVDFGKSEQTGLELLGHAGGTGGYSAFIGFEKQHHRGVVILFNRQDGDQGGVHSQELGWLLLEGAPLTPQIIASLFPNKNSEIVGIGCKLGFDQTAHRLRIENVLPGTPASQAGLQAGLIVETIDEIPTAGKSTDLCARLIRGTAGTKVRLELLNPENHKVSEVELIRQSFTVLK